MHRLPTVPSSLRCPCGAPLHPRVAPQRPSTKCPGAVCTLAQPCCAHPSPYILYPCEAPLRSPSVAPQRPSTKCPSAVGTLAQLSCALFPSAILRSRSPFTLLFPYTLPALAYNSPDFQYHTVFQSFPILIYFLLYQRRNILYFHMFF